MPTAVRSHAKINLGLTLGAPREDGFHSLVTVYQTIEMHDVVTVTAHKASATTLKITSNDSRVPSDSRNTAWKMVTLALDQLRTTAEVEIHIDKRLPVQGGLGAGSGNAVAALVGLETELSGTSELANEARGRQVSLPPGQPSGLFRSLLTQRLPLAAQVGSDVPLFLIGGTVLGVDRGQEVYPLADLEPTWCVVVVPEVGVSTPQAFRDWDALCAREGLTPEASADRLKESSHTYAGAFRGEIPEGGRRDGSSGVFSLGEDLAGPQELQHGSGLVRTGITSWIENDFERVVFPQHPSLAEIKRLLAACGTPEAARQFSGLGPSALWAALSGSGSALFGLYLTRGDAEAAQNRIERESQALAVRNTVITRTLPRKAYWEQMIVEG